MTPLREDDVENEKVNLFRALGWDAANVMEETFGSSGMLAIEQVIEELARDYSTELVADALLRKCKIGVTFTTSNFAVASM